ncbi:hypothetical protein AB0B45_39955 [Nonomuraea sp. NPDC049152]|uniref:hypothetical protein n=1 Tax=Nonomuraea sp. NPDC049152 TaxID=3154350 RepID=UPI003407F517
MNSTLLWLHIAFAIFAIGPLTAVIMASPRAIRAKNAAVLQTLQRMTRIYGFGSLGVLVFGIWLALSLGVIGEWYMTASMTLFLVSLVLLFLVERDLRAAVRVFSTQTTDDDAKVESGRIAALGGLTGLIYLVILFLMVVPGD